MHFPQTTGFSVFIKHNFAFDEPASDLICSVLVRVATAREPPGGARVPLHLWSLKAAPASGL